MADDSPKVDLDTLIEKQAALVQRAQDSLLDASVLGPDLLRAGADAIETSVGVLLKLQGVQRGAGEADPRSLDEIIAGLKEHGIDIVVGPEQPG